jgi:polyhydroxybutyrate depolymerase
VFSPSCIVPSHRRIGAWLSGWHNRLGKAVRRPSQLAALRTVGRGGGSVPAAAGVLLVALLAGIGLVGCGDSGTKALHAARHPSEARVLSGCAARPAVAPGGVGEISVPVAPRIALGDDHRIAFIHVPRGYRSATPTPVVLEFHGAGQDASAAGYLRGSPLDRISDRAGFLDVFPQGLRYSNGNLGWNAYSPVNYPVAELPFLERLIARLKTMFCVDARRIYASGISNGANMVNYLSCRSTARLIAAVAPVAGPMYGQDDGPCAPPRPVPILDIHSVNDRLVPFAGRPSPPDRYPLPSVSAWLRGWARLDQCRKTPESQTVAAGQTVRHWAACGGGAEILAYAVHAGHAWPATLGSRSAAEVVWQFFQAHPLP